MSIPKDIYLSANIYHPDKLEKVKTRDGYGKGLVKAGGENENIVVLCADLTESTRSHWFKEKFPERFVELGVAEQNMATVASGMAAAGKIPFISSYAVFSPGRNNEQIRTTISLNCQPVKIGGAHAGVSVGPDGATHQALEDIALMRVQPHMTVLVPCDATETEKATYEASKTDGPVYIRFARAATSVFTTEKTPFKIGRAEVFREGGDVTVIGAGPVIHNAFMAAKELEGEIDVEIVNCHTVKPLDEDTIMKTVKKTGAVVTLEEHQINGGLGGAISEFLGENYPVSIKRVGINDRFGESGEPMKLIDEFGMGIKSIKKAIEDSFKRKNI